MTDSQGRRRLPAEFKQSLTMNAARARVGRTLDGLGLNTVCRSARCPNCNHCFSEGTATFLILGPNCTRACTFCAVSKERPVLPDPDEPGRVAQAVAGLGLRHAVITSVTRDDLDDGGAGHLAATVHNIRRLCPGTTVEILVPDFGGDLRSWDTVCELKPEVFNHNIETVKRLYAEVRPGADYRRSLEWLRLAADRGLLVKSGFMVGLGESRQEVEELLQDLAENGCRIVTVGQYLAPSPVHRRIDRFWDRREFEELEVLGRERWGMTVVAGPLVRSSFSAGAVYHSIRGETKINQF